MELVEGTSLEHTIDSRGPLPLHEIVRIGSQIASGLRAAHQRGLVHRDIKPANILLEASTQRVKITDFGLARAVDDGHLSKEGRIAGTPQFMSPEQAKGLRVDHRSDLFSLGCVLYAMCTGRLAFSAATALTTLRGICDAQPAPIHQANASIPPWLEELVGRLLEKDPNRRPQTAGEVAHALLQHRSCGPAPAPSTSPAMNPPAALPPRRQRWIAAALASVALVFLAGVIIIIKSPDGQATRIEVPLGAHVRVASDGKVEVDLAGDPSSTPAAAPKSTASGPMPRTSSQSAPPAGQASPTAVWEQSVATLAGPALVAAVSQRLRQVNTGFDGQLTPTLDGDAIAGLELVADHVSDLSPLRVLPNLKVLVCGGSNFANPARLADLSPLQGLPLTTLLCGRTRVADLAPLKGMPLETLDCADTRVHDLSPLIDMPLRHLSVQSTHVSDLSPLKNMPLVSLNCAHTQVTDFGPLAGIQLHVLICDGTKVKDLSALRALPLRTLNWRSYDYRSQPHCDVVRSITTLEEINGLPAAQFWKQVAAQGE
jgi:hypothetical protein